MIFGLMMCTGMVIGMTFYNLVTQGMLGQLTAINIVIQLATGFLVAAVLETIVVGPLANKAVKAMSFDKSKKGLVVIAMACCMVTGMVLLMSLYGWILSSEAGDAANGSFINIYVGLVLRNFVFALPLQLLVVGPLVRCFFALIARGSNVAKQV